MIPTALLNTTANVSRRTSTGRDALNNPTYGQPTGGAGWNIVYRNIRVRFAFSSKGIRFAQEGERLQPNGIVYYNIGPIIKEEDRFITEDGIEYTVTSVVPGYTFGKVASHMEAVVQLP